MSRSRLQPIKIPQAVKDALDEVDSHREDSSGLLNALIPHATKLKKFSRTLTQATVFWSLSSVLQELRDHPELLDKFRPSNSMKSNNEEEKFFSYLLQAEAFTSASIVFRTWVSLVYIRIDDLVGVLEEIQRDARSKHFSAFLKLIKNDEVRHLRNAVAHGTIDAFAMELNYRDEKHSGCFSYDQLDRLNFAIYTFLLSVSAASQAD